MPTELEKLCTPVPASIPRLFISLDGQDKCGKSHYAFMTAPEPILVISTDTGTAHVARKAIAAGRKLQLIELDYPDPDPGVVSRTDVDAADLMKWQAEWKRFKSIGSVLARDKTIRTLVYDTGTGLWQLCRLAHHGKLKAIPQHLYGELNSDFASSAYARLLTNRPDLNIIMLHQTKKQYAKNSKGDDAWNGKFERDGYGKVGFGVDISLTCGWDGVRRDFYTGVGEGQATRLGPQLSGLKWYGEENNFGLLLAEAYPEVMLDPERWGVRL